MAYWIGSKGKKGEEGIPFSWISCTEVGPFGLVCLSLFGNYSPLKSQVPLGFEAGLLDTKSNCNPFLTVYVISSAYCSSATGLAVVLNGVFPLLDFQVAPLRSACRCHSPTLYWYSILLHECSVPPGFYKGDGTLSVELNSVEYPDRHIYGKKSSTCLIP